MKKLFMAVFTVILVFLGTPALVATLMYDGSGAEHMPVHLYVEGADAQTMLFQELDQSIKDLEDGTSDDLVFNLHQDIINTAIYQSFLEENPDYAPGDDCVTPEQCYVFYEPLNMEDFNMNLRLVGAWVSFYDGASVTDPGRFVLNAFVEVELEDGFTYKTVIEVHFLFEDDPDYYYLEFDKIQLGRLPIPKSMIAGIINTADDNISEIDLEDQVANMEFGEFNLDNLSYTIQKDEILAALQDGSEQNGEADAGAKLSQEMLSIIFDNQLVEFELVDEEFTLTAGVSQFKSDEDPEFPVYLYDLHDQEMVDGELVIGEFNPELFNPENQIQDMFTEYVFNSALIGDDSFRIDEELFNKLIYFGAEGFSEMRGDAEIPISEDEAKLLELGLKAIWFEFEETDIYINALFKIGNIDSKLVIRAENTSTTETELRFEFVEINFGKDENEADGEYIEIDDLAVFKEIFSELGDVEFGEFDENGDLVITVDRLSALMQDGAAEGAVEVASISIEQDAIVLGVAIPEEYQAALDTFQSALNDVLEDDALTNELDVVFGVNTGEVTPEQQAVIDSVEILQTQLITDPANVEPEQVEELFNNFGELDEESQADFIEAIGGLISEDTMSGFESIFGSFLDEIPEEETPEE